MHKPSKQKAQSDRRADAVCGRKGAFEVVRATSVAALLGVVSLGSLSADAQLGPGLTPRTPLVPSAPVIMPALPPGVREVAVDVGSLGRRGQTGRVIIKAPGTWTAYYGIDGRYVAKNGNGERELHCAPEWFDNLTIDLKPNVVKKCYLSASVAVQNLVRLPSDVQEVAGDNQRALIKRSGPYTVWYGINGRYVSTSRAGEQDLYCHPSSFNDLKVDLAPGVVKKCFVMPVSALTGVTPDAPETDPKALLKATKPPSKTYEVKKAYLKENDLDNRSPPKIDQGVLIQQNPRPALIDELKKTDHKDLKKPGHKENDLDNRSPPKIEKDALVGDNPRQRVFDELQKKKSAE